VPSTEWTFDAARETPMLARRAVMDWVGPHVDDPAQLGDIALAVTEATTNAVLHAYRGDDGGAVMVEIQRSDDLLCLYVRDEGSGLAPRVDSPGLGLGLGLIAQVSDGSDVRSPVTGGTEVVMRFNLARS
jgi:serine/threonine-protein kinase RsbW/stage II sporulation protein AB (anti-sigma F factor)